jgi:hypothetical protein
MVVVTAVEEFERRKALGAQARAQARKVKAKG